MQRFNKNKNIKVHFIGIGGIGMSGIAAVVLDSGYAVTGSDINESENIKKLRSNGATVFIGHKKENIQNCTTIVYSSAIDDSNPEVVAAKANGIPLIKRAEMLAELMRLKHGLAIAGTHGKTTTTSFLATILEESEYDPTYIIGGIVDNLSGHAKVGKGRYLVAEADESDGSFLMLNPVMSVITNLDYDHMDFYKTKENLHCAFEEFMNKIPFYGLCAINADDEKLVSLTSKMKKPYCTFGIDSKMDVNYRALNIEYKNFETYFDLYYENEFVTKITLALPGKHNVLNSLGAISLAHTMGLSFEMISKAIIKFKGVNRRFQLLHSKDNFEVLDDYGHHPTEVLVTLETLREIRPNKKIIAVFQPHRYSRTKECWDEFVNCFNQVDEVLLTPIYAASEKEIVGISSDRLAEDINKMTKVKATRYKSFDDVVKYLDSVIGKDVTIISLGAGSIGRDIRKWLASHE